MSSTPISVTIDSEDYRVIRQIIEREPGIKTPAQALVWALRQWPAGGGGGGGGQPGELATVANDIYRYTPLVPGVSDVAGLATGRRMVIRSLEHSCKIAEVDVRKADLVGLGFDEEEAGELFTDHLEAEWL